MQDLTKALRNLNHIKKIIKDVKDKCQKENIDFNKIKDFEVL